MDPFTPSSSEQVGDANMEEVEAENIEIEGAKVVGKRRRKLTSEMEEKKQIINSDKSENKAPQDGSDELDLKAKKYLRGDGANLEVLQDKKLRGQLTDREKLYKQSAKAAAKAEEWLLPCDEGYLEADNLEKTWMIKQENIVKEVDLSSSRKAFDFLLKDLGPYTLSYTMNGRYLMLGGRKGHLAMVDMMTMELIKELQVRETVRDVVFLQNEQMFAVAQKKYTYIYNRHGTEMHCLKDHDVPLKLQYLEKHFLLASINKKTKLHYQDISTGLMAGTISTGLGRTKIMQTNHYNSVISLGHSKGVVTMWAPTSSNYLMMMRCHAGPVSSLAFHPNGHLMATSGADRKLRLWDLRKPDVSIHSYKDTFAQSLDFSQKGLLALSNNSYVNIWKDTLKNQNYEKYMSHNMVKGFKIEKVCFRPYEDVLGIGHSDGISSILVPGAGEPNFDSWVANPYETKKQRREKEIHSLLDKLQPETIMLDPNRIGKVNQWKNRNKPSRKELEGEMQEVVEKVKGRKLRNKTKGRSKPSKVAKKKEDAVLRAKREFAEEKLKDEGLRKKQKVVNEAEQLSKSLQRFVKKTPQ